MPLSDPWLAALAHDGATVICSHEDVENSVRSFLAVSNAPARSAVASLSGNWVTGLKTLWRAAGAAHAVVVTHECCWPALDLVVAIRRPRGVRTRVANLNSMKRMTLIDILQSGSVSASTRTVRIRRVFRVGARVTGWPFFNMYEAPGPMGSWVAWVPREWISTRLRPTEAERLVVTAPERYSTAIATQTPKILIACGLGTQDDDVLREIYINAITCASESGFTVLVKDHVRPNARLNLQQDDRVRYSPNVEFADPQVPAEALAEWSGVSVVVGIDSAVLGLSQVPSVSLLPLVDMPAEGRKALVSYLLGLPRGQEIEFVDSMEGLGEVLAIVRERSCRGS